MPRLLRDWPTILMCVLIFVATGILIHEASSIPAGVFEPLGSAPIPIAVCAALAALSLWQLILSLIANRDDKAPKAPAHAPRRLDVFILLSLTVLYVYLIGQRVVPYAVLTTAMLFLCIATLSRFERSKLMPGIVLSVALGFGLQWVFTSLLYVDLPTW